MRLAAIQLDVAWLDVDTNLARAAEMLTEASGAGAELAVLPEMFATGFSVDPTVAEAGERIARFVVDRARTLGIWVAGSVLRREAAATCVNQLVAAGPDGTVHHYDKRHPFTMAGEHRAVRPGHDVVTFRVGPVRVTPFVCYDLRFAPDFWDAAAATDLYVVAANWPRARHDHWTALLRARSIENQAFVLGVNRTGAGGGVDHAGGSMVVDPWGTTVAEAGDAPTVLVCDIEPELVTRTRASHPFVADRTVGDLDSSRR